MFVVRPCVQVSFDRGGDPFLARCRYSNPELSPSGHLLETAHKAELAADLQRAILARKGGLEESPLERAYRQLVRPTQRRVPYHRHALPCIRRPTPC